MESAGGSQSKALLVEDDPVLRRALARDLRSNGTDTLAVGTLGEATDALLAAHFDVLIADANLPDGDPIETLRGAVDIPILVITGDVSVAAPRARALGLPVLEKPFAPAALRAAVAAALGERPSLPGGQEREPLAAFRERVAPEIIGESEAVRRALALVQRAAPTTASVLIRGETGTGKEWLARAIHRASGRPGRLVAVNCAAIPESMVEGELFGHVRGAFTGAVGARDGHVLASDKGTLFLDELGELPLSAQAKLLRVLQEREVTPVGSSRPTPVDLRVVAATHRDLRALAESGQFRPDLLYRLDVIGIRLAPLRERPTDIPALAERFRELANERLGTSVSGISAEAMERLVAMPWPGNVRELQNVIERAAVLRQYGAIEPGDVLPSVDAPPPRRTPPRPAPAPKADPWMELPVLPTEGLNLRAYVERVERALIEQALRRSGGNRNRAAALLGMKRTTLVERLRRLDLGAEPDAPTD